MKPDTSIKTVLVAFLLLAGLYTHAQNDGKITGRVVDSATGAAVSYASISLNLQDSNKVVTGTITGDKGDFKLSSLANGTYTMLIFFVGYHTQTKSNITLSSGHTNVDLGNIKLASTAAALKAVTVAADKSIIENKIDKLVYNVDNDVTSKGGVATDVLQKVPEVTVDVDGNVELQGNSNVRFLIDGKPSTVFGNNITDVLQSIPASQIQSIEVITSPGAKYDASGTGGIINIVLKKNKTQGINGNISATGGTRLQNGSLDLSAHKGGFTANLFFSGNAQLNSTTLNSIDRIGEDTNNQSTHLVQNGTSQFSRGGYESGLNLEWDLTSKDIISVNGGYDYFENNNPGNSNREIIQQDISGNPLSDVTNLISTANNFNQKTFDWGADYKHKFKKDGQELDLSYNASYSNNYSYYRQLQEYVSPPTVYSSSYGNNPGNQYETNLGLDYSQPIGSGFLLETGAKATLDNLKSTSNVYLLNTITNNYDYSNTQSFSLNYTSNVYAGYVSGTFKLFKTLDVLAGFRDEYTQTDAWFSNSGNANIPGYNTAVPSITLAHTLKKNQTIKISYSYRIERPRYSDLNPFIDASDPQNVTTGNPNLQPEVGNKIEASYSCIFGKGANIIITPFYRWNNHDIQSYTYFYPTYTVGDSTYSNVSVTTRENIGQEDNLGAIIFGSIPLTSKINLRPTVMLIDRHIHTGLITGGDAHGFIYRIKVNATYQVTKGLTVEAFGNFRSVMVNAEGTKPSFMSYDIALRQQLFHKKGSIALTATNAFNKYVDQTTNFTGENFTLISTRDIPYRSFGINFTYMFGKKAKKKQAELPGQNLDSGEE